MWKFMYLSPFLLLTLIGNYILDSLVIFICLKYYGVKMKKDVFFRMLTMAWILGFTSDILALMGTLVLKVKITYMVLMGIILVSGILLFFFNRFLFLRVAISKKNAYRIALITSLMTSPWILLIPTSTMY